MLFGPAPIAAYIYKKLRLFGVVKQCNYKQLHFTCLIAFCSLFFLCSLSQGVCSCAYPLLVLQMMVWWVQVLVKGHKFWHNAQNHHNSCIDSSFSVFVPKKYQQNTPPLVQTFSSLIWVFLVGL